MPKTVFLIFENAGYDGQHLHGVFSSREIALTYIQKYLRKRNPLKWNEEHGMYFDYLVKVKDNDFPVNSYGELQLYYIHEEELDTKINY